MRSMVTKAHTNNLCSVLVHLSQGFLFLISFDADPWTSFHAITDPETYRKLQPHTSFIYTFLFTPSFISWSCQRSQQRVQSTFARYFYNAVYFFMFSDIYPTLSCALFSFTVYLDAYSCHLPQPTSCNYTTSSFHGLMFLYSLPLSFMASRHRHDSPLSQHFPDAGPYHHAHIAAFSLSVCRNPSMLS